MAYLADHQNVYKSCMALLELQGWEIRIEAAPYELDDARLDSFIALRNGTTLRAEDPLRLLGLATIDQHQQPHGEEQGWWSIKGNTPNLYERLEAQALEQSFFRYLEESPTKALQEVVKAIENRKIDASISPAERLGISEEAFTTLLNQYENLRKLL